MNGSCDPNCGACRIPCWQVNTECPDGHGDDCDPIDHLAGPEPTVNGEAL